MSLPTRNSHIIYQENICSQCRCVYRAWHAVCIKEDTRWEVVVVVKVLATSDNTVHFYSAPLPGLWGTLVGLLFSGITPLGVLSTRIFSKSSYRCFSFPEKYPNAYYFSKCCVPYHENCIPGHWLAGYKKLEQP